MGILLMWTKPSPVLTAVLFVKTNVFHVPRVRFSKSKRELANFVQLVHLTTKLERLENVQSAQITETTLNKQQKQELPHQAMIVKLNVNAVCTLIRLTLTGYKV